MSGLMRLRRFGAFFYRAWGRLPAWTQDTLVYLGAPKSTFGVAAMILDHEGACCWSIIPTVNALGTPLAG